MSNVGFFTAAMLAFATLGTSHLVITNPVPYGKSTLNNSPLNDAAIGSSGSDYPCKQRAGVYDITSMNHMAVGQPQELSFEGSASHGGGTCQLAVSLDKEPTANSTFKIIQVFEGGCPINSDGNGETHPFTYSIPKGFPNGQATLAWLWYNKIGNREAYMNCAPITVTGGSDSQDYYDSLPNMYVINLPTSECQSSDEGAQNSVVIPNPGQFIMKEANNQDLAKPSGPGCAAAASKQLDGVKGYKSNVVANNAAYHAPGGSGGGDASSGGASAAAPSGAASSGAAAAPSAPAGGSSAAAGGSSGMVTVSTKAPVASAPAASAPAASSPAGSAFPSMQPSGGAGIAPSGAAGASGAAPSGAVPSAPAASSAPAAAPSAPAASGGASSSSCSGGGAMTCSSDGKQFGVCDNGKMVWRAVAPGTTCKNGAIARRSDLSGAHLRRHLRHAGMHAM